MANEWGANTTRSITSLICSGTPQKSSDVNSIFSHGGGGLTAFAERLLVEMVTTPPHEGGFTRMFGVTWPDPQPWPFAEGVEAARSKPLATGSYVRNHGAWPRR
jgi:hypothetical protein